MTRPLESAGATEARIPSQRAIVDEAERSGATGRQFIVCGDTTLAYRLVEELSMRYRADVTVILADPASGHGPSIARMNRVRIVRADQPDADAFRAAGLTTADAVALVSRDDVGNVYAALQAQEICPGVRVILRVHNSTLVRRLGELFEDAQVLSDVEIAAPAFVAASLGVIDPTVVPIGPNVARVVRRSQVGDRTIVCGLAVIDGVPSPVLLPDDEDSADLVLVFDNEVAAEPKPVHTPRRRVRRIYHNVRRGLFGENAVPLVSRGLLLILGLLSLIVLSGMVLFWLINPDPHVSLPESAYLMLFTSVGAGNADLSLPPLAQIVQTTVTLAGVAMIPLVSAAIVQAGVHARLALSPGALDAPESDHVVVVGLGNLGTNVLRTLHERGREVVAVDHVENPVGAQYLRENRIHFVVGDARRESTLRRANVSNASALVVLTTDDVINLEYALQGRELCDDLRVVLRLFDGDFADRVNRTFNITTSRSVSYLAAPAFAAAMFGREVIGTIPVRRRVLLVAEVPVVDGSWLVGKAITDVHDPGQMRLLAIRDARGQTVLARDWARVFEAGDRLVVVGSRVGLSRILEHSEDAPIG